MRKSKLMLTIVAATFLGACNSVGTTRNAPIEVLPNSSVIQMGIKSSQSVSWRVEAVRVNVPDTLTVSEANLYLPKSDIVWREDLMVIAAYRSRTLLILQLAKPPLT